MGQCFPSERSDARRHRGRVLTGLAAVGCLFHACQDGASGKRSVEDAASVETPSPEGAGAIDLPPGSGPVAIVEGEEIPRAAFNRAYRQTLERYGRANREVKPALRERLTDNIVGRLVDQAIVDRQARTMGITLDAEVVSQKWATHKTRYGSDEAFRAFLERAGTSEADLQERFRDNLLREALFAAVARDVDLSGQEVRDFYDKNRARYEQPEMVRARHILIRVPQGADEETVQQKRKQARKIRAQAARKGADFSALAAKFGEDPTKDRGGDLGWFPRGRMVKAFEDVVWKLKKGQISKPVKTQFGFHIIEKLERRKASTRSFEEVHEQIEQALIARKRNEMIRSSFDTWKKEADVEIRLRGDPDIINATYDRPSPNRRPFLNEANESPAGDGPRPSGSGQPGTAPSEVPEP